MTTTPPENEKFLYLATRGRKTGLPREIEIWFARKGACFYVIAEHATSQWVRNIQANPQVQIRAAGKTLPARARVLSLEKDSATIQFIQELFLAKHG